MNGVKLCLVVCLVIAIPASVISGQQKPYPVVTEVKDGVRIVTNPDFPKDGRYSAKLTVEMSCGEEGGPQAGVLNKPLRLDVDDQGNVYVMDYGDVNIKVYDGQGHFLRAFGRQGQGPGDFGGVVFFNLMTGGRICVLDMMQHRIIIMTNDGRYVSGFTLDGFFRSLAADAQDRLFIGKWSTTKEMDKLSTDFQEIPYVTSIYRADASGKELVHLTDFLGESIIMKSSGAGAISGRTGRGYMIVWNISREGKLYGGCNGDYSLGVFGPDGKKEFAFGRRFTPVKNVQFKGMVGQKKTMPAYQSIVIDEAGNLWIEITQADDAKGVVYDVFSPDGIYLKQVAIEQKIDRFKNGKIYSIVQPEEGYPSIKRYKLELIPSNL